MNVPTHKVHAVIEKHETLVYIAPLGYSTDDILLFIGSQSECEKYLETWQTGFPTTIYQKFTQEQIDADNAVPLIARIGEN